MQYPEVSAELAGRSQIRVKEDSEVHMQLLPSAGASKGAWR